MTKRLIIHTDSIAPADVNTFRAAAILLRDNYKKQYPSDNIIVYLAKSGLDIVTFLNQQKTESVSSLDIISHGNQGGIHIARNLKKPIESGFIQRNAHFYIRDSSPFPQTKNQAKMIEETMHGLYIDWAAMKGVSYYYNQDYTNSTDTAYLSAINFKIFLNKAFVEFHGCRTAEVIPFLNTFIKDNFASQFSSMMPKNSVVVGHIVNSNPNLQTNGKSSDYRHGKVRAYMDSEIINDSTDRKNLTFGNSSTPGK
ncbi:MAG: hypothetical protein GY799_29275 [Desulfobulbaceae bacterium]|nr:hypothetical protein [Desulfobulbaceae bacterium]